MENAAVNFFLYSIVVLKNFMSGRPADTSVVHCLYGGRERAELIPMPA